MVRLTAELILQSAQYTNPVRDRELDLRDYRIPLIENMGATLDQFDTIDLSDNDIWKLAGFPLLRRLKSLLLNNNRIVCIAENLTESLPNLDSLILTNNNIKELGDLDSLTTLSSLRCLSLLRNPVTTKKHYRLYIIHKLPFLRLLDFRKIKLKEREAAAKMFKGKRGQQFARDIGKRAKTFAAGATPAGEKKAVPAASKPAAAPTTQKHDVDAIKAAIANAKTLEEVEKLNQMLKVGQIPGQRPENSNGAQKAEEMET